MSWPIEKIYAFYDKMRSDVVPALEDQTYPVRETRADGCLYATAFSEANGRKLFVEVYDYDKHMQWCRERGMRDN